MVIYRNDIVILRCDQCGKEREISKKYATSIRKNNPQICQKCNLEIQRRNNTTKVLDFPTAEDKKLLEEYFKELTFSVDIGVRSDRRKIERYKACE